MCNNRWAWIIEPASDGITPGVRRHNSNDRTMSTGSQDTHHQSSRLERRLTEREQTILALLAHGKRNREISEELAITERTVKFHVSGLFAKLGARNRTEAVRFALQRGLVHL